MAGGLGENEKPSRRAPRASRQRVVFEPAKKSAAGKPIERLTGTQARARAATIRNASRAARAGQTTKGLGTIAHIGTRVGTIEINGQRAKNRMGQKVRDPILRKVFPSAQKVAEKPKGISLKNERKMTRMAWEQQAWVAWVAWVMVWEWAQGCL